MQERRIKMKQLNNTKIVEQIKAYEAAHNAYAVDKAIELLAEDVVFEMVGLGTFSDLSVIRRLHEYDKAVHAQITFQNCKIDRYRATCQVIEQNDWLTTAGLGDIFYPSSVFTFTPTGKIQKITATLAAKDRAAIGAVLAKFTPWIMANYPHKATNLFTPNGEFIYSEANGNLIISLLAHWRGQS